MALKRALVVDDSKLARVALKKQLEEYDLSVALADSGEEALEYLKYHMVDVVFMDHIMPGIDGLEAVAAIKSNPLTATIPVMMYTSKEGEVYVSQARALGALDVLPKQVEPGVLFGMLLKLGLVRDRRAPTRDAAIEQSADTSYEAVGGEPPQEPVGMTISALLTRILEDQHSALRSDILGSHRNFAKQVANEVYERQNADRMSMLEEQPERYAGVAWPVLTVTFALALIVLGAMFLQVRAERDAVRQNLDSLMTVVESERSSSSALNEELVNDIGQERARSESAFRELLGVLTWTMNQSGAVYYDERPLNEVRTEQIRGLLLQLSNAGFQGTVRVESHLGEFCLTIDSAGIYQLAEPELPFTSCAYIGHPLDDSSLLSDRQTPSFEAFLAESPLVNGSGIDLDLIMRSRLDSVPRVPYPAEPESAGEWNQVAALNNRVEYSLLSDDSR